MIMKIIRINWNIHYNNNNNNNTIYMGENASIPMEAMPMIMKRHAWYILIINLGIKQICREMIQS